MRDKVIEKGKQMQTYNVQTMKTRRERGRKRQRNLTNRSEERKENESKCEKLNHITAKKKCEKSRKQT